METGNVPFKQLTDEQKGWLLLQHHKGRQIQKIDIYGQWVDLKVTPLWVPSTTYRVKPSPISKSEYFYLDGAEVLISWCVCPTDGCKDFKVVSWSNAE